MNALAWGSEQTLGRGPSVTLVQAALARGDAARCKLPVRFLQAGCKADGCVV